MTNPPSHFLLFLHLHFSLTLKWTLLHHLGEKFTSAYKDTLQSPLQPLMDNLESQTYETFERDPVKYERYEVKNNQTPSP